MGRGGSGVFRGIPGLSSLTFLPRKFRSSLEKALADMLGKVGRGDSSVIEDAVEACVVSLDCGVVFRREEVASVKRT